MTQTTPAHASTTPNSSPDDGFCENLNDDGKAWLRKSNAATTKVTADAKAEGLKTNPDTAIIGNWFCQYFDPYGVCDPVPLALDYAEEEWFVCDPYGNMWVLLEHLPVERRGQRIWQRIEREW